MKPLYLSLICLVLVFSCKSDKEKTKVLEEQNEVSIAKKIANAHGFNNWQNVSEINFTFNVDQNNIHFERSWSWNTRTDAVWSAIEKDTTNYSRKKLDSLTISLDKKFVNDKFWLLVPFQLAWDTSATISKPKKAESPISKEPLDMITITYPNEGGYTPGDAYDIYFDESFLIREWVFRKGNSKEPSLTTTFENYKDYKGIKIATTHKKADGEWNLNFTNVSITLDH
ncbi:hypothetical protein [Winogradskyella sp. Asnod2-B02-A]|uniref:hypothetical protein n=1 Tax=Winogradskyella sp. Asnod2-B02-A TaxID=3160583 RepID=UPI003870B887